MLGQQMADMQRVRVGQGVGDEDFARFFHAQTGLSAFFCP
jgi:hypothetical protein